MNLIFLRQGLEEQKAELKKMAFTINTQERLIATVELQLDSLMDERRVEGEAHRQQVANHKAFSSLATYDCLSIIQSQGISPLMICDWLNVTQ